MLTARARAATRSLVTPIALGLGRLGLTPDALTVMGTLLHVGVAWLIATERPLWWGAIALAGAASFDALDGALARESGRNTPFGAFLDSTLDRISEVLLFLGLLARAFATQDPALGLGSLIALSGSLLVSYTRARSEGIGRDTRAGIFGRLERMLVLVAGLALNQPAATVALVALGAWVTVAQRVLDVRRQCRDAGELGAMMTATYGDARPAASPPKRDAGSENAP